MYLMYKSSGQKHKYMYILRLEIDLIFAEKQVFSHCHLSSSPSAIAMEEKEAFRRVNSGKSSGENKPFSS